MNDGTSTDVGRLICGERGVGAISWRGTNMLVIDYDTSGETNSPAGSGGEARMPAAVPVPAPSPAPRERPAVPLPPRSADAPAIGRDALLASLRSRSDAKLERSRQQRRHGDGRESMR